MQLPTTPEYFERKRLLFFGITETLGAALGGLLGGSALATGIGTGIAGAGLGAGIGTVTSAIEGKPLGEGALFGGITGGAVSGLGPTIGSGLESAGVSSGTATTLGDVAAGAAGGLVGSAATGQSPLTGVIEGGGAGLVSGLNASGGATPSGPSASTTAAAVSPSAGATGGAGGAAAPGAVALPASGSTTPVDPTSLYGATSFETPLPAGSPALSTNIASGTAQGAGPYTGGSAAGGVNNLLGFLGNNPGLLLGGGVLGLDLLKGNQPLPGQTQVQNQAASEASVGNTLSAYAQSGTLPAGLQDIVNQNTNAGIAQIRSNFAQLGLTGSTMEAQAIDQVHQAAAAQTAQLANQLLSQGAQFTGLSNQEFNTLLQSQLSQEQALQSALGSFAGGLAGFRSPTQPTAAAA